MPSPEPAHRAGAAPEFPPYRSATAVQAHEGARSAWKRPSTSSCPPPEIRSADTEKDSGIFRRPSGYFSQNAICHALHRSDRIAMVAKIAREQEASVQPSIGQQG